MSNCNTVSIDAFRGATVKSPNFFDVEEIAPPSSTIADIEQGILDGTYTPVDPNLYTYKGQIRADYGQGLVHELALTIEEVTIEGDITGGGTGTYYVVNFKIPPNVTDTWENREHCLNFDIKRTLISDTTEVDIWVVGGIKVLPTITE